MVIDLTGGRGEPDDTGTSVDPAVRERRPAAVRDRLRRWLPWAAVLAALALTAAIFFRWGSAGEPEPVAAKPSPSPSATALTVPQVYETLLPSVVFIQATGGAELGGGSAETATGTGVVVNADGTVLTALHVVQGATAIQVTFADGTRSAAK